MNKTSLLDGLVVAFVVAGFLAIGSGVFFDRPVSTHVGFTLWWLALLVAVVENYKVRRPVQTRGGVVRKEDGAVRYALPYVGLGIAILVSGVMLLAVWLMP